jgi:hypothetical protein
LSIPERRFFEPRFGHNFGEVRIHDDAEAGEAAQAIGARAYTLRNHIAFASGAYDSTTTEGRRLLAHELTHTLQQGASVQPTTVQKEDGPTSSVEAFDAFTPAQRRFLSDRNVDPAGLPLQTAEDMASLLDLARRAHVATRSPDASGPTLPEGAYATVQTYEGQDRLEMSVLVGRGEASVLISRTLNLSTGQLTTEFVYQDRQTRVEVREQVQQQPRVLERFELEAPRGPSAPETNLPPFPIVEPPEAETGSEASDDFSDLLPSGGPAPASEEGIGSFFEGAIIGDFGENESWSAIAGQTVIGFVPIAGQIADVRDLGAAIRNVGEGRSGAWMSVGVAIAGFVPGLDFLKGGTRVGRRALREAVAETAEGVTEAALRRARRVLSRAAVETARRRLRALAAGRVEMLRRLGDLSSNPALSRRTQDLVRTARNSVRDHMTPADLSGALRDRLGIPVRQRGSGAAFDHLGEVHDALDSLADARRALLGDLGRLRRNTPGSPEISEISEQIDVINEMRRRVLEFLETR